MSQLDIDRVWAAIELVDNNGVYRHLFTLVNEQLVWSIAPGIFSDPIRNSIYGRPLTLAIAEALEDLEDQVAAATTLHSALQPESHSGTFEGAQQAVLQHAPLWDKVTARLLTEALLHAYTVHWANGDPFIARLAIEGATHLLLARNDRRLLRRITSTLMNDFPLVPDDVADDAPLPVVALRLLGQCYDVAPDDQIADVIAEHCHSPNVAVRVEAIFNHGIVRLYDAFRANDGTTFREALLDAHQRFETAYTAQENRSDAELFAALTACFKDITASPQPVDMSIRISLLHNILRERLMVFGGISTFQQIAEVALVRLITTLNDWQQVMVEAHTKYDLVVPLHALAQAYSAVRTLGDYTGLGQLAKLLSNA